MPTLTLTAKNTTGGTAGANVSTNEAAFLTGVFSAAVIMSDFSAAQAVVDSQMAALKKGDVAFVMPGVQIMVFPVGLVITGTWMLLGVVAFGFGTMQRMTFAESYKRRQAYAIARVRTI